MRSDSKNQDPMEWARNVLRERDERGYNEAYDILIRKAKEGDPTAEYYLGLMYARGQGVARDYDAAVNWFQKASDKGSEGATYYLGKMYANGVGVERNSRKAEILLLRCAGEDVRAQYEIGLIYFRDEDVPRNLDRSAKWMLRAAKNGHAEAQFMMGQFYKNGAGVERDMTKALEMLTSAAMNGHKGAQIFLGNMYRLGDGVDVDIEESERWYDMADGKAGAKRTR